MSQPLDVEAFRRDLETFLLEGEPHLNRQQVAGAIGVPVEDASRLWRALGFADVGDDVSIFADIDVEILGLATTLARRGILDDTLQGAVTRTVGQAMSRLAEWQVGFLFRLLTDERNVVGSDQTLAEFVREMVPTLERFHSYAWRRHLNNFAARTLNAASPVREQDRVVGFVDMAGYTSLTRKIDEAELGQLLEEFEALAADTVASHHARVVKSLGDEVMFLADHVRAGALLALEIVQRCAASERLPDVRGGLAYGPMISRLGDVYGSTVNLASRLTSIARPSSVLVDRTMADVLRADDECTDLVLRPLGRVSVRGFPHLQPWLLRRAA